MKDVSYRSTSNYSIKDIIEYRALSWGASDEFLIVTDVPIKFEPFFVEPNFYCFGMINQGKLEININNNSYDLSPNSLMVYRPGQAFKVNAISKDTKGVFILFTRKFLNYLDENIFSVSTRSFLSYGIRSLIELSASDKDKLQKIFQHVLDLLQHRSKQYWEPVARNLASALIYETDNILQEYISTSEPHLDEHYILFNRFNTLVGQHFHENRKLPFYLSNLCVSNDHLYSVIKKISGKNPTMLINQKVVKEATFLITNTALSISEIAYKLNFSDPFTFSKFFKKHTGQAPSHYRENSGLKAAAFDMQNPAVDMA